MNIMVRNNNYPWFLPLHILHLFYTGILSNILHGLLIVCIIENEFAWKIVSMIFVFFSLLMVKYLPEGVNMSCIIVTST